MSLEIPHEPICEAGHKHITEDCPLLVCAECGEGWPCEVVRLRAVVDRIEEMCDDTGKFHAALLGVDRYVNARVLAVNILHAIKVGVG